MTSLQEKLMSSPDFALQYAAGQMTLDMHACKVQMGGVLLQEKPDKTTKSVEYWRLLTSAKIIHDKKQRECLAIVWVVLLSRPYIEDTRFNIRTDRDLLKWIRNVSDESKRFM